MKNKIFFIFFLTISFIIPNKAYSYSGDPEKFISEIVLEAKQILIESNSKDFKTKKLSEIASKTVDIDGIGIYTLGSYAKNLSAEQKKEYKKLFREYFLKSFTSRLTDYSDPKINVLSSKVLNDKYTMVNSLLIATDKKPEVKINWRIYTKNPDKPLIRDLIIEGLSLARTQKEEFSSVIETNNGDISKLFIVLKEFVNN
jgi:phospholipid transport system substrate-binding protein